MDRRATRAAFGFFLHTIYEYTHIFFLFTASYTKTIKWMNSCHVWFRYTSDHYNEIKIHLILGLTVDVTVVSRSILILFELRILNFGPQPSSSSSQSQCVVKSIFTYFVYEWPYQMSDQCIIWCSLLYIFAI